MATESDFDVIVVGAGNAGYSAATTAAQAGCRKVLLIDKGPEGTGGNTYFTAGAYRTVFHGLEDVLPLVCNVSPEQAQLIDMEPYTEQDFWNDLQRVTDGRTDREMAETLVKSSREAIKWLGTLGIQFTLSFNRQAYLVDGRQKFWGGMVLSVKDGGKGLVADHKVAALKAGVTIWHDAAALSLIIEGLDTIAGVNIIRNGKLNAFRAAAVVLACGGFESDPKMRAQHLGPGWDRAYVRGTPHNTGDGFRMTEGLAKPVGNWSGCHSTAWDAGAPTDAGDVELTNQFTKSGYPLGVMINNEGNRFVDEGVDFRNFTYAKFGREILGQPGGVAFQIWDSKTIGMLRAEEYGPGIIREKYTASSLEELAQQIMPNESSKTQFLDTMRDYNDAVKTHQSEVPNLVFNPAVKDGFSTQSSTKRLALAKSNWAVTIEDGPFLAVKVSCGITFTFGGISIDPKTAAVMSRHTGLPVPNLFCCGEMVGGIFWGNYPGKNLPLVLGSYPELTPTIRRKWINCRRGVGT